ncbi:hypothetical protein IVA93_31670 [Bradyrhizobium sp. 155]|uniref:hypothetical protein n=1 Tax=Bradyrhizobium sp. 155 TaxID=2782629 RepID=UPI001FFFABE7|nr:hypothetical protein [Bradyrhizobium sp. 155]UPK10716.1 hypothetical protein IVA93_31670 [Bradyrhizobium sp. 155]
MSPRYPAPPARRLRVYAFDPQTASRLGSVDYAFATISLPWGTAEQDQVQPGPINDYVEVIDVDPASRQFYDPVDLNNPYLLAQDGLTPSEGNPQFHQQMVFAVAMKIIHIFERALGRKVIWAPHWNPARNTYEPVDKLRIYPHALREANAYYSMAKRALLFGYFRSTNASAAASWIFTALSHDIVAHETTHAVLDGLHRRYAEATSVDSLAFHEAFADIVALMSHFTLTEAVSAHIQDKGGSFDQAGLLSGLAEQFARGTVGRTSLRQYVGHAPKSELLAVTTECHERGAILVAAVFDAFLTIYKARTDDLLRIGNVTRGEGKRLNTDLVARLTREAVKSADHVLRMCIRALDYLPPVDVRFGEFLRAIITADTDLVPDDSHNYRIAFAEAFRGRGILVEDCLSMSPENLLWETPEQMFGSNPLSVDDLHSLKLDLTPHYTRKDIHKSSEANRKKVHEWLRERDEDVSVDLAWENALGVYFVFRKNVPHSISSGKVYPNVEVHSVRTTRRAGPDGQDLRQLVIEVTQRRRGYFDPEQQKKADADEEEPATADFIFRGGATLIIDLKEELLRYVIRKPIADDTRLDEQRKILSNPEGFGFTYNPDESGEREPFAMIHRGQ